MTGFWVTCSRTKVPCFLDSLPFFQFATNEAIQRTEAYEYAQSLGAQTCSFPNFQVSGGGRAVHADKSPTIAGSSPCAESDKVFLEISRHSSVRNA